MANIEKPKCPHCNTSEYVVLVNTGESIETAVGVGAGAAAGYSGAAGGVVGNKVGEQIDKSRKLFKCNKCSSEITG